MYIYIIYIYYIYIIYMYYIYIIYILFNIRSTLTICLSNIKINK